VPTNILPGYTWAPFADANKTRYRSTATGQFVSRNTIHDLLTAQVNSAEHRLGQLLTAFHDGRISASTWQVTMRTELTRTHLQYASLGIGGWERMGDAEYGRVGGLLWRDLERMADLARGIQDGTVSLAQAQERVRGYIGNARINYFEAEKTALRNRVMPAGIVTITIRDLGQAQHCGDCLTYHQAGWSYELPSPGTQCECSTHCRCDQRWRDVTIEDVDSWIGTRR
jgi:hypothetical protein